MTALADAALDWLRVAVGPLRTMPWPTWALIILGSFALWPTLIVAWSLTRWLRDLLRPDSLGHELTLRASDDGYIMLGEWGAPWIGGAEKGAELESKQTTLLITYGRKTARGTVRYSQAKDMVQDVLGIPQDIADKLELHVERAPIKATVSVRVARRFALEKLWNNPDLSIKVSFRTAVWLAVITTALSVVTSLALEYLPRA